jgi:glutathione S-transferase
MAPYAADYRPQGERDRYSTGGSEAAAAVVGGGSFSAANAAGATVVHQQPPAPQLWSAEQVQRWVDRLETRWTAADVAAFVEGRECRARGAAAGWLGVIWE